MPLIGGMRYGTFSGTGRQAIVTLDRDFMHPMQQLCSVPECLRSVVTPFHRPFNENSISESRGLFTNFGRLAGFWVGTALTT